MGQENKDSSIYLHNYKGVDYRLRFDYNTVCDMEEAERTDLPGIMLRGLPGFRTLTFYGLKNKHKNITKERAGEIIQDMIENNVSEGEESGLALVAKRLKEILLQGKFITVEEQEESQEEGEKKN